MPVNFFGIVMKNYRSVIEYSAVSGWILLFIGFFASIAAVQGQSHDTIHKLGTPLMPFYIPSSELDNLPPGASACPNSNFSEGDFTGWTGCYGSHSPNTCTVTGFLTNPSSNPFQPPLHKIIGSGWLDENTDCAGNGTGIITAYTGEDYVVRIGDTVYTPSNPDPPGEPDYKAAEIKYAVDVSAGINDFFIYRYAVVLQSGGHTNPAEQPDFLVEIVNGAGQPLDPVCGSYHFTAPTGGNPPPGSGWNLCNSNIYWRDWTTVGLNLSAYDGQTVYIRFVVQGCVYRTHFGYAYVSAFCSSMNIALAGCEGSGTVTMTGPPGFVGYEWNGPGATGPIVGTEQVCTVTAAQGAVTGNVFYLKLTAVNGCVLEQVGQTIMFTEVQPDFTSVVNCTNNESSFTDISTSTNPGQPIINRKWRFDTGDPFTALTTNATVAHTYTVTGSHEVTVESFSQDGCVGTATQTIYVGDPPLIENLPATHEICSGENVGLPLTFNPPNPGSGASAFWTSSVTSGIAAISNNPAGQTGTLIDDQVVNAGPGDAVVTYLITPTIGDCIGSEISYDVTVHPLPGVDPFAVATQVYCNGESATAVPITSPVTGATFEWTNSNTNIGLPASGTGDVPVFTATNTGTGPINATITANASANNCDGPTQTYAIIVNPSGQVDDPTDQVVCNGASTLVNFGTINTGGTTTYNWTNNTTSIGLGASGAGNIPAFVATNTGNSPVVATVVVTPTFTNQSVSCVGPAESLSITVNPTAQVDQPTSQVVCNGSLTDLVTFTTTRTGGTSSYSWTNSNTTIGLAASGTGDIAAFTAIAAGSAPVVSTIIVTPHFENGSVTCNGPTKTFTITVNPTAQVDQPASQVVCNGAPAAGTIFTTGTSGGTASYTWTNSTTSIGLAASGTGDIAGFTAVAAGTTPVVATIVVTPHFENGSVTCDGPVKTFTITVNPTAQVDQPASQVICNSAPVAGTVFTTGNSGGTASYTWTNSTTSIGLAASGTGDIAGFTAIAAGTTPVVATIIVTPHFENGSVTCDGPTKAFTITVNPTAQVDQPASQVICNGAPVTGTTFTTGNSGGTASYTWTNSTTSIGLAASGTGDIAGFTGVAAGTIPVVATIIVTPHFENGSVTCDGPAKTFTITVNPTAQVDQPASQVICNSAPVAGTVFTTGNSGGTASYTWTNSNTTIGLAAGGTGDIAGFTAIAAGTTPAVATIIVTPHFENGSVTCNGPAKTFTITVNPTAQVDQPASQVICNGAPAAGTTFTTGNSGGTASYTWTNSTTSIGLAASGTGDIAGFSAVAAGTTPVVATIIVTPHFENGSVTCDGPPKTFTITVNPTAQADQPASQVICNGAPVTGTVFTTGNSGGTASYTWTNSTTGIGLAASGTGDIAGFTAINAGTVPVIATIIVTPHFENGSVTCDGPTKTFTITVNPTAQVNQPANQVVCNGAPAAGTTFTTGTSGGTASYTWTNSTTSIGLAASGTGDIAGFTAAAAGTTPVVATIVVTPHFENGSVTCDGPVKTFTITVNPTAQVDQPASQVICNGAPVAGTVFTTGNSGGTASYTWTNSTTSIGLSASGTGDIAGFSAIAAGTTPVIATIIVTPHFENGSVTCDGPTKTFTITVNPTAQVDQPASQVLCNGNQIAPISFTTVNTGGTPTYSWTNSATTIGLAANGNGDIAAFSAVAAGATPVVATIIVTPHFENGSVTCDGPSKTFTITINPTAQVNQPANPVVCHNTQVPAINFTTLNSGGTTTYTWTNSTTSIGLPANGSGNIPLFTGNNPGSTPVIATVMVTPHFSNGSVTCDGPPKTFTITINPLPVPVIHGAPSVCAGTTGVIYYTETSMVNYQWVISSGGSFAAGPGTNEITVAWGSTIGPQTLTVNYINSNGCTAATPTSYPVTIQDLPTPSLSGVQHVCVGATESYTTDLASTYAWTIPSGGGTYTGGGPADNQLTMHWLNQGVYTIYVNYTVGATGCTAAIPTPLTVTVNPNPTPSIMGPTAPICGYSTQNYYTLGTGHDYQWTITGGTNQTGGNSSSIFVLWGNTPPVSVDLTEKINYTGVSCSTVAPTFLVSFKAWPSAPSPISGPDNVCISSSAQYSVPPILNATAHNWAYSGTGAVITGNGSSIITITFSAIATSGSLTVTGNNDCGDGPVSTPLSIQVNPRPVVDYTFCNDAVTTTNGQRFILKGGTPLLQGIPAQEGYSTSNGPMGNNPIEYSGGNYYFNPGLLTSFETGVYPIVYRYTNQYGCDASSPAHTITVINPASILTGCPGILTDPRVPPPNTYHTVWIGSHCWMQENLHYGTTVQANTPQKDNCTVERYCLSADNTNCTNFGGLYQWDELMGYTSANQAQGLCPPGWHIPNEADWDDLIYSVSSGVGTGIAGSFLTNLAVIGSFKADPAGIFYLNSIQAFTDSSPKATFFWTSAYDATSRLAVARGLNTITPSVSRYESSKVNAFPVRCVKD